MFCPRTQHNIPGQGLNLTAQPGVNCLNNEAPTPLNFFIMVLFIVDGGWSEWTEFRTCDAAKCGNGTKMLRRFCSNPEPENGGQICTGDNIKIERCQDVCPGNI